ncbi:MAG: sulfatase-like hydrolase/transferase [Pseudomonadales bacterium]
MFFDKKLSLPKWVWIVILVSLVALPTSAADQRTNIILIMADDVSPDIYGVYGQPAAAKTPNVDRLASQGVTFKTAWATAMCGSSRVEIMTGRYANTTGVYHNRIWIGDSGGNVYTDNIGFSKILHEAGYATAITGKWHAGVQQPYEDVLAFEEYALWENLKEIAKLPGSPKFTGLLEDETTTSRYWHPAYVVNGQLLDTQPEDFSLDIEAEFIKDFMSRSVAAGKPFLAYWPTVAPHGTRTGQPTNPLRGEPGVLGDSPTSEENEARFRSLNEYLDLKIGEVMAKVDELGIADNTVIIFVSDNGTAVTAKTRGVERGPHVVFVAAGKGIKNLGITDELTDFSDIAPTLIEIAGAENSIPQATKFDGKSLMPFLSGQTESHREWIYAYIAGSQLLRTKDYMLEVVNPVLGTPKGRFYHTGNNRFGHGYVLVGDQQEHQAARQRFDEILAQYSPLTRDHEFFKSKKGKKFLAEYEQPKSREKHLYSHKDYDFYDQTYVE